MARILAINDLMRVAYVCRLNEQLGINVVHYRVTLINSNTITDEMMAVGLSQNAHLEYKAYLPAVASFRGVRLQVFQPIVVPHVVYTGDAGNGTVAGDPLPTQACILVSSQTALAGRPFRGRTYLPFWTEGDNDLVGKPNAAAIAKAGVVQAKILNGYTLTSGGESVTIAPVVYSRVLNTPTPITQRVVREHWATQRRRSQINQGDPLAP